MNESNILCPHCGKKFQITEALSQHLEEKLRVQITNDFEKQRRKDRVEIEDKIRKEILKKAKEKNDKIENENKELQSELLELKNKVTTFSKKELTFKRKEREFIEREVGLETEIKTKVEERLGKEIPKVYEKAKETMEKDWKLKLAEEQKKNKDLGKQIEEIKKKSDQGSVQMQGEVQELDIENTLKKYFPDDEIISVVTGKRGGDIVQIVKSKSGKIAGKILWESKRTKNWQDSWIQKLKEDQREEKAELSVIVSEILPKEINYFGQVDGIWISDIKYYVGLCASLRENLKAVSKLALSLEGKTEKMELVYNYLTGTQFKQRVESILETFKDMKDDLDSERRSTERNWAKRDQQINKFVKNMAGMYGDIQGTGTALPSVKLLELSD